ncbi:hypothetical protein M3Y97_01105900 [Aphelenchoides bicaudatus]|nr:hypothetical protein M3Y97_01105900 [Aphelenchoides bicaudatus]
MMFNNNSYLQITTNINCALVSVIHPILLQIPRSYYSFDTSNYFGIFITYLMIFCLSVMILILDVKFLLIGLERKYAIDWRHSYEQKDGTLAKKLILRVVIFLCIFMAMKDVVIFFVTDSQSTDDRLIEAFQFESFPLLCASTNILATFTFIYALYQFYCLNQHNQRRRFQARSLSESYQIRETELVVNVLKPLASAYVLLDVFCALVIWTAFYYVYSGCTVHSLIYRMWINFAYVLIAFYTFMASLFMLWKFSAMRHQLFSDIHLVTGIQFMRNNKVEPLRLDAITTQNQYFDQLKTQWS